MTSSTVNRWLLGASLAFGAGCAAQVPGDEANVSATSEALTVMDCQTTAAECLGTMPSAATITQCRDDFNTCLGTAASDAQSQANGLADCRDTAVTCAQTASTFADAAQCRTDFNTCISAIIQLPSPPAPPTLSLPMPGISDGGLPNLPAPGSNQLLSGEADCRSTAMSCVQSANGDVNAVAACASDFRTCMGKVLSQAAGGVSLPTPPSLPDAGLPNSGCRSDAMDCVQSASGDPQALTACRDAYLSCMGVDTSALPKPDGGLPTPPAPPGGTGGSMSLPPLTPPTPPTLPTPPPPPGGDCLQSLNSCLLGGGMPTDCAQQARTCAGM